MAQEGRKDIGHQMLESHMKTVLKNYCTDAPTQVYIWQILPAIQRTVEMYVSFSCIGTVVTAGLLCVVDTTNSCTCMVKTARFKLY